MKKDKSLYTLQFFFSRGIVEIWPDSSRTGWTVLDGHGYYIDEDDSHYHFATQDVFDSYEKAAIEAEKLLSNREASIMKQANKTAQTRRAFEDDQDRRAGRKPKPKLVKEFVARPIGDKA
jgi:hypothetical protein